MADGVVSLRSAGSNGLAEAFAQAERVYKRTIYHQTFGHLAPKPDEVYTGFVLFTYGCCGDIMVIDYDFKDAKGVSAESSPWIWEDINSYVGELILPEKAIKSRLVEGRVYLFKGTYTRTPDTPKEEGSHIMEEGVGTFKGRTKRVKISMK